MSDSNMPAWMEPLRAATFRHLGLLLPGVRLENLQFSTGYLPTNMRVPALVVNWRHPTCGKIAHFNFDWTNADIDNEGIESIGRVLAESLVS